ncbi:MAG: hypothetical protein FK732_06955, partial [Asgard group archaeon]|nr:hypothetical protein [Asgard group archaeon]
QFAGEAPQIAWLFGHFGVPTPLVVGDDAVCREVDTLLPGIKSVVVKNSKDRSKAKSLPLAEAHALIEQTSFEVISQLVDFSHYVVDLPVTIEVSYLLEEMATIHAKFPKTIKATNNSVKYTADDYLEAWLAYNIARVVIDYYFRDDFLKHLLQLDLDVVKEKLQEYRSGINKKIKNQYPFSSVKY